MDEVRPRPRPTDIRDLAPRRRADLLRYFAWGYLSRRELTQRLNTVNTPTNQPLHSAA